MTSEKNEPELNERLSAAKRRLSSITGVAENDLILSANLELEPRDEKRISETILSRIDEFCVEKYGGGFRRHLGGSAIGDECSRKVWLNFRWIKAEEFTGRQLRLFQRGHLEEPRFIEYLEGIGAKVFAYDPATNPDLPKDKRQVKVSAFQGHFGGSLDGIAILPKDIFPYPVLLEFKTSATGAKFANIDKNGVRVEKAQHWSQMNVYGYLLGLRYALYMVVNKNDDSIIAKFVELNESFGESEVVRAGNLIMTQSPPPRCRKSPASIPCKFCHYAKICHLDAQDEVAHNCRSCINATPDNAGTWRCAKFNGTIPDEFIAKGCDEWESILKDE